MKTHADEPAETKSAPQPGENLPAKSFFSRITGAVTAGNINWKSITPIMIIATIIIIGLAVYYLRKK